MAALILCELESVWAWDLKWCSFMTFWNPEFRVTSTDVSLKLMNFNRKFIHSNLFAPWACLCLCVEDCILAFRECLNLIGWYKVHVYVHVSCNYIDIHCSSESLRWPTVGRYKVDIASFESLALPELQVTWVIRNLESAQMKNSHLTFEKIWKNSILNG